jgi:tRNA-specific 2-thiouridylase
MKYKQKVLLGLSGGVDSAVAALILQKQGYEVVGVFMRCFSESKSKITGECPWIEDKKSAQKIASALGIKFIVLNYEKEYTNAVIKPMFRDYARGLTPNPDSACNTIIKFPYLWKEAKKYNCSHIATGHYIKKIKKQNKFYLSIPKDKLKDQSYFLYGLSQEDLKHTLFPIGDYTKSEVRKIAKKNNLENWDRKGTRGLCFVGNIDMKSFLKQKIKNKPGIIQSPEGRVVGKHDGMMFYTIGERLKENQNVAIDNIYRNQVKSKLYIAKKDIKNNILVIAPKNHSILKRKEFKIKNLNLISGKPWTNQILVRVRHLGQLNKAKLKDNKVILDNSIEGLAPGQSAVLYTKSKIMLGGGEISY